MKIFFLEYLKSLLLYYSDSLDLETCIHLDASRNIVQNLRNCMPCSTQNEEDEGKIRNRYLL